MAGFYRYIGLRQKLPRRSCEYIGNALDHTKSVSRLANISSGLQAVGQIILYLLHFWSAVKVSNLMGPLSYTLATVFS